MIFAVMGAIFAIAYGGLKNSGLQQGLNLLYCKVTDPNLIEVLKFSGFHMQLQKLCSWL